MRSESGDLKIFRKLDFLRRLLDRFGTGVTGKIARQRPSKLDGGMVSAGPISNAASSFRWGADKHVAAECPWPLGGAAITL
jgi:hypothetical protein